MAAIPPPVAALSDTEIAEMLTQRAPWQDPVLVRSALIALISTLLVFGGIGWLISGTEGWDAVQRSFFSWKHFRASFPQIWDGFKLNIKIFMIAEPIILTIGMLLAIIRSTRSPALFPLRAFAVVYTDLFRGAPALLVILTLGFGVPALRISAVPNTPVFWGTVAIILSSSAYQAETFRAGIGTVHGSQRAAARALGLSSTQTMQFVVLPQAVRRVIPPTLSGFVGLQKETALISVLGPLEATRQAQIYGSLNFNYTSYVVAGLLFISITIPLARFTDYLLRRSDERRSMGGAV
ncbi:MAG: amino acid ABC transporter permease [Thermomicrobiales bacterium]